MKVIGSCWGEYCCASPKTELQEVHAERALSEQMPRRSDYAFYQLVTVIVIVLELSNLVQKALLCTKFDSSEVSSD